MFYQKKNQPEHSAPSPQPINRVSQRYYQPADLIRLEESQSVARVRSRYPEDTSEASASLKGLRAEEFSPNGNADYNEDNLSEDENEIIRPSEVLEKARQVLFKKVIKVPELEARVNPPHLPQTRKELPSTPLAILPSPKERVAAHSETLGLSRPDGSLVSQVRVAREGELSERRAPEGSESLAMRSLGGGAPGPQTTSNHGSGDSRAIYDGHSVSKRNQTEEDSSSLSKESQEYPSGNAANSRKGKHLESRPRLKSGNLGKP